MGVFSNKIGREELKPGDHIYSWRQAYIYAHHGIYVGDGMVIHFTRGRGQEIGTGTVLDRFCCSSSPANAPGTPCPKCGDQTKTDGVISSCLDCFLSGHNLYLFKYGVSPAFFLAQARGGTCTVAVSDPPEDVLHRASFLLKNGFGCYNIFKNNCEDFAIYCKTGLLICTSISVGRSGQAASYLAAASAVVSTPLRLMTTSLSGLAVVGYYGTYCVSRLVSDIGMRRDVSKVAVERLIASPGSNEPQRPIASAGLDEQEKTTQMIKEIETTAEIRMTKTTEEDVEEIPSSVQKPTTKRSGSDNKRGSIDQRMCDQFDRVIESLNSDTTTSDTTASVPSIGVCLDLLKQLPGLEYGSETHLLGIRLMKSKSNREIFVQLGDPILQINWIKTHTLANLSRCWFFLFLFLFFIFIFLFFR